MPAELAALVAKMMAKDPARRFQTPSEVAQALMPFFKKPGAGLKGSNPNLPLTESPPVVPARGPRFARGRENPTSRPSTKPAAESKTFGGQPIEANAPEANWSSLIEFKETANATAALGPIETVGKAPPKVSPLVAVGGLVVAFVLLWAGVLFMLKTRDGKRVPENLNGETGTVEVGKKTKIRDGPSPPLSRPRPSTRCRWARSGKGRKRKRV